MTTNEMIRADELLQQIEAEEATGADAGLVNSTGVQTNPYIGIASAPFSDDATSVLLGAISDDDIEIRPDGLIYLPEIKYRRILNRAFGPGAWSLLPLEITVSGQDNMVFYKGALFVLGRFVSEAIGEQHYDPENDRMSYATAAESAKSNCLLRCCKDLGIASELWDPAFVRRWVAKNALEVWCVNVGARDRGKKKKLWRKADAPAIDSFPWREDNAAFERTVDEHAVRENGVDRPAARAATRTSGASSTNAPDAQLPLAPMITPRQVGRFRAIGRSNGWTDLEQNHLLAKFGFGRADDVTRDAYDRLCKALENPVMLTEVRADVDEELAIGIE